jgi:copper chaperone CopZ
MISRRYCLCLLSLSFSLVGCSNATNVPADTSAKSATPVAFNVAGAPTVEFSAPDMMCPESCAVKVKEILSEQPGAKEVVVDFDSKTATVAVEEGKFDADAAIAALVDHGFDHSTLKSAAHDDKAASDVEEQPAG